MLARRQLNSKKANMVDINNNTFGQDCVKLGDYVFASPWSDCDPNDLWAVGFVTKIVEDKHGRRSAIVSDLDGKSIANVGNRVFQNLIPISRELGKEICKIMPRLEGTSKPECGWKRLVGIPEIN